MGANLGEIRLVGQIQARRRDGWLLDLMQAKADAIDVEHPQSKRLGDGLGNERGGVVLMQVEHRNKHPQSRPIAVALAQPFQQPRGAVGPGLAPLADGDGMREGTRALHEQREVVQRVKQILLTAIKPIQVAKPGG